MNHTVLNSRRPRDKDSDLCRQTDLESNSSLRRRRRRSIVYRLSLLSAAVVLVILLRTVYKTELSGNHPINNRTPKNSLFKPINPKPKPKPNLNLNPISQNNDYQYKDDNNVNINVNTKSENKADLKSYKINTLNTVYDVNTIVKEEDDDVVVVDDVDVNTTIVKEEDDDDVVVVDDVNTTIVKDKVILDKPIKKASSSDQRKYEKTKQQSLLHSFSSFYPNTDSNQQHPMDLLTSDKDRMNYIKEMIMVSWDAYLEYSGGADDLKPCTKDGLNWISTESMLATPVDSLDTLFLIGDKKRFNEAKKMVLNNLTFADKKNPINLFETIIRVLGGLLSAYELDGDMKFIEKAIDLADRLIVAFDNDKGFPLNSVYISDSPVKKSKKPHNNMRYSLAEIGSCQLEFDYLSDITGNPKYRDLSFKLYDTLKTFDSPFPGLYPSMISFEYNNPNIIKTTNIDFTVGSMSDSFYEYLLKVGIASKNQTLIDMYFESAEAINEKLLFSFSNGNANAYSKIHYSSSGSFPSYRVEHLECFMGGLMVLGSSIDEDNERAKEHFEIGKNITDTCVQTYLGTETGLGPETYIVQDDDAKTQDSHYHLRPETIESVVYMWRATKDNKWKELGWEMIKAIEKRCRIKTGGYSGLKNVMETDFDEIDDYEKYTNKQESFFIAETLKYAYLLYASDDVLPFSDYMFNTEAHPLSIKGKGKRKDIR